MRSAQYTKAQVLAAERVSWADPGDDEARYSYDGISFWRHSRDGRRWLARASETPAAGWRHAESCNCAFCREASAQSEAGEKQVLAGRRT